MPVVEKLATIIFPQVQFLDVSLQEVAAFLALRTRELDLAEADPTKKGVNFLVNAPDAPNVTLTLTNVVLNDLLAAIADQTGTRIVVEDRVVVFSGLDGSDALLTRTFRTPPDFLGTGSGGDAEESDDPFAEPSEEASGLAQRMTAKDFLEQNGVVFPEGSAIFYNPGNNTMVVRNTAGNLAQIEDIVTRALETVPRQVLIRLKMLETDYETLNEFGVDWLLGGFNTGPSERVFAAGGTVGNQFAGERGIGADFPFRYPAAPDLMET